MLVDFFAYAGDCTVSGRIDLAAGRLSDRLDRAEDVVIHGARLHGFVDEPVAQVEKLRLGREDLFAVEATDVSGGDGRRIHTVRHLVRFLCGRYRFIGELHTLPGAPPLQAVMARRSMVPLTNAVAFFDRDGSAEVRRVAVLIVNGRRIERAELIGLDDPELHRLALGGGR